MKLTVELPQPIADALARASAERGLSPAEYAVALLDTSLSDSGTARKRLERLLLDGASSGEGIEATPEFWRSKEAAVRARFALPTHE